jgi:hypothetical protein
MNKNRLYFLHIPKTAGKSVSSELKSELEKNNISTYISTRYPNEYPISNETYISGHFGTYPLEKIPGISVSCLVRNPIEARVSYFNFIHGRNDLDTVKYRSIDGYLDKLKYYLFEDEEFFEHNNYQSRHICNPTDEVVFKNSLDFEKNIEDVYSRHSIKLGRAFNWFIKNDKTSIDNAINKINSFDIVNTVESIDLHYISISKWFEDKHNIKINLNPKKIINSSETLYKGQIYTTQKLIGMLNSKDKDKILENNNIDYKIYSMIRKKEINEKQN